jgi:hypothetical protein
MQLLLCVTSPCLVKTSDGGATARQVDAKRELRPRAAADKKL